jgi:hypothetical protein
MAGNTKVYYFRGTGMWSKFTVPDKKFGYFETDLHLDDESLQLFKDADTELKLRDGEIDGKKSKFVKLRRKPTQMRAGDLVDIGPPKVFLLVDGVPQPFTDLVGNGSQIVCKVSVYPTPKGNGHRLESVLIEKLVEYKGAEEVNTPDIPF